MEEIKWLEVTIPVPPDQMEQVSAQLIGAEVTGMVLEEEGEFLQFLQENRPHWDYVDQALLDQLKGVSQIKFYVTDDQEGREQLAAIVQGLDREYTVTALADNDWAYSWQAYYKPMPVGERLYLVPQWERDQPIPPGRVPCYLNPGLTFGTGSHPSTQLCLEGLEELVKEGDVVLDLGCGSGILSVAALVLGAERAIGVDLDPKAVAVSEENAGLNGLGPQRYQGRAGNVLTHPTLLEELSVQSYPLILANLVADVIIPLAPHIPKLLTPEGVFLCSGIIEFRREEVEEALKAQGFTVIRRREQGGWVALEAQYDGGAAGSKGERGLAGLHG